MRQNQERGKAGRYDIMHDADEAQEKGALTMDPDTRAFGMKIVQCVRWGVFRSKRKEKTK